MNFTTMPRATRHETRSNINRIHLEARGPLTELTCEETGVAPNNEQSFSSTDFPKDVGKFVGHRNKLWKHLAAQFHCHILVHPADEEPDEVSLWVVILLETLRLYQKHRHQF